ncbi:hypothetical protein NPIL_291211 [Nephila pilipes]|uniref:Uncharacterized protein n=1 Tax=Nephila pilipes TaxID=299642 RepID=A0A8X6TBK7_NEPPI|nr:hypothetical protein NPIL_75481 [Nephila pilipes]GFS97545.1 hypothetical protein NPIL_283351 [Nephila pilipes]GFT26159.1 hypothetical protein NPIL_274061 [Nephila pilipes]GFT36727.1 hypothetical protein NPIL_424691 [Nephila pilipes]GFT43241.1 hypothetical protein NPIL_342171 [Nephila pilipes]
MKSWALCPNCPKPSKGSSSNRNINTFTSKKMVNNFSYAQALNNAPRPQMAPHKPSESETSAQNEARSRQNPPPKFPGLAHQLPRIAAVKK